jgi:hypothetical protein
MAVFADNGADVYLNGRQLLANSTVNKDAVYWNSRFSVLSQHWWQVGISNTHFFA